MMDSLRRYVWVVDLIGIMFGAGLAGHAVATRLAPARPDHALLPARRAQPAMHGSERDEIDRLFDPLARARGLARVQKLGPHLYEVPRGILDQMSGLTPPAPVIVPQTRDDQPAGLRIFGIDRYGLLAAIGLANGDVLLRVNGVALNDPQAALDAYAVLKGATHVWLVIERDGQRIRIDYIIR